MERYTIFFDWKSQYWYNDHTTQGNLQIQWKPYQITDGSFHRIRIKKFNFVWKHERPRIAKTTSRKNGCWKNHTFWCFSPTLLVGMQTGTATIENSAVIPWITGTRTAIWPSNPTAGSPRKPDLKETHVPRCSLQHNLW